MVEDGPFDLGVFHDRQFYRLQVKRAQRVEDARWKDQERVVYTIPFRKVVNNAVTRTYKYTIDHADFIVGVVVETGDLYCFPMYEVDKMSSGITITANGLPSKYANRRTFDPEPYRNVLILSGKAIRLAPEAVLKTV